ncbi:MAG: hypothetical protein NTY16_06730 [Deltaproteobacteria bacterium]|nr:hypothetical protein [Deltaproteobacteria bacterium]
MNKSEVLEKMKDQYDPYKVRPMMSWDESAPVLRLALFLQEQCTNEGFYIYIDGSEFIIHFEPPIEGNDTERLNKALQVEQLLITAAPDLRQFIDRGLVKTERVLPGTRVEVRFPATQGIAG